MNEMANINEGLIAKYKPLIQEFSLMDDTFMSKVFEDKECAELVLSIILGKKLKVVNVKTQYGIDNLHGRSIRLDIRAVDTSSNLYDIEIENDQKRATPKRGRFNISIMDTDVLDKNEPWDKLPETYMIFITRDDVLGGNKPIYHIDRTIRELNHKLFDDETHIIYVPSKMQDDTELGRLMHDFNCKDPSKMYNKILAERTGYFKNSEEGVSVMCAIMEQVADERERETILKCIKQLMINCKFTIEQAMQSIGIPKEEEDIYIDMFKKSK
ncbi:MAG: PD-(D/E)XK nuclease family transposase [Firmicutes bacterium]|nr:PD-(D/E)XK nuclease family transposase [Bacillota bacterium]